MLHLVVYSVNQKGRSEATVLEDIAINEAEKRTGTKTKLFNLISSQYFHLYQSPFYLSNLPPSSVTCSLLTFPPPFPLLSELEKAKGIGRLSLPWNEPEREANGVALACNFTYSDFLPALIIINDVVVAAAGKVAQQWGRVGLPLPSLVDFLLAVATQTATKSAHCTLAH